MSNKVHKFDTLSAVCKAVKAGEKVHWKNEGYVVGVDMLDNWYVAWMPHSRNPNYVGLFHTDGVGSEYTPCDFYVEA